jgi:glycosyltransferase involved in cell wall biosynthesis
MSTLSPDACISESAPDVGSPKILIDGVFFQLYKTGIARVWQSLLEVWSGDAFCQNIVVLDRGNTAPRVPGIEYRTIPSFSYENMVGDREMLQQICEAEGASLFISTYYTTPITTPSVFMGYDMIPEVLGADLTSPMWQSKHHAIDHAIAHITISKNTAQDLQRFFPSLNPENISPILCGVADYFHPASQHDLLEFRDRYNLQKPYFLLTGPSFGYKNAGLFLEGLAQLQSRRAFDVVCTGSSGREFSAEARKILPDVTFHPLFLEDHELRAVYSGAIALVYPSTYEGFGLPVVEAMKCGCPVITCANASIPEVGGEAVMYVPDDSIETMAEALLEVQKPGRRSKLIKDGLEQAKQFNWSSMAQAVKQVLVSNTQKNQTPKILIEVDWNASEESIYEHFTTFFKVVLSLKNPSQYDFLIDAIEVDLALADEITTGAFMEALMEHDSAEDQDVSIRLLDTMAEKNSILVDGISQVSISHLPTYLSALLPR